MNFNVIETAADEFVTNVVNPTASDTQKNATKETFIAGVDYAVRLLSSIADRESENDAFMEADLVEKELEMLKEKIINGELRYVEKRT